MKTIKKTAALIIIFAGLLFNSANTLAQVTTAGPVGPAHDEIRSQSLRMDILGWNPTIPATTPILGQGINAYFYSPTFLPQFMFDVYCDPTLSTPTLLDINVGCPNCTPANSVGYRIGDSMIIWHNGILSSVFVGVYIGGIRPEGLENTFVSKFC